MRLYFLRHGIAEDPRPGQADGDRRLTPEGIEQMRLVADALKRMDLKLDRILTSPLIRARQTAEIVADALGMQGRLQVNSRLAHGCTLSDLQAIVREYPDAQRLMLVGHNPSLPMLAGVLVGGAYIDLKKGGLIRIDIDRIEPGHGVLEWLLTPALLTKS